MQRRVAWPPFTTNLKITLGVLGVFWLAALQIAGPGSDGTQFLYDYMFVSRETVLEQGRVWTLLSYAVWHMDFSHLLFNGVALWMFGGELDRRWDPGWFWGFCALCALGGGVTIVVVQGLLGASTPTLGYSAAIMGLVAAFCWHNWNRAMYFFFVRLRGKWLLGLFVLLDILLVVGAQQPISISGHLGGMATGLLLVSGYWRPRRLRRAVERAAGDGASGPSRTPDRKTSSGKWVN